MSTTTLERLRQRETTRDVVCPDRQRSVGAEDDVHQRF